MPSHIKIGCSGTLLDGYLFVCVPLQSAAAATEADASDNEPSAKRPCPAPPADLVSSDAVENGSKSKAEQEGKAGCHGDTSTVTSTACEQ